MTPRIGNSFGYRLSVIGYRRKPQFAHRKPCFGFTLIEVMVATAILSLGVVMLYHSFFICADSLVNVSNRLNAQMWAQEKIWEAQERILKQEPLVGEGSLEPARFNERNFDWKELFAVLGPNVAEYTISLSWKEAGKPRTLSFSTYL